MESARLLRDLTEKLKSKTGGTELRSAGSVKNVLRSAGARSVRNGMERDRPGEVGSTASSRVL